MKSLYWGPVPDEKDGGAAVACWQLQMMHDLKPSHEFYGVPKRPTELNTQALPFMKYLLPKEPITDIQKYWKDLSANIPKYMSNHKIPLLWAFHIAEHISPLLDPVHEIDGKLILWQTVHWEDDLVFRAKNLADLDYIVAATDWAKQVLSEKIKISQSKIETIPHGVDIQKFFPHETNFRKDFKLKKRIVILFTGRYDLWKGIQELIPLIRPMTEHRNCTFVIKANWFGMLNKSRELHEIFKRMSLRNKHLILLDQWLPYGLMPEITASADILVSPTGHEGFNCPLTEAMSSKVPVIVTDLPNHREIVGDSGIFVKPTQVVGMVNTDEETGYKGTVVRVPSSDKLLDALTWLIENPEERKIMGENGRKRVEENYSLAPIADKWLSLFDKLTKSVA